MQACRTAGLPMPCYLANTALPMTVADKNLTPATRHFRQSVAAGMVLGFIGSAVSRGADRRNLLDAAGLPPDGDIDPNRRVPLELYAKAIRSASSSLGDPAIAIRFAETTNFADLSIVGLIGYASTTMRDALDQLNRYGRLVMDICIDGPDRFTLSQEEDGLWLTDNRVEDWPFPELTESTFVRMVAGTRQFGDTPYCSLAEVTHTDDGTRAELERALGAPVRFGAGRNAMRVSVEWQDYRIAQYPRYAFSLFCAHADSLLAELEASRSMAGRVERALLPMLHSGRAGADAVARQLGLSGQGLYRALKAEGTTFEEVLATLRHRFAKGYLAEQRASLKEVAYLLGYSDVSAFSRAFRRREGVSPGAFQAHIRQVKPTPAMPQAAGSSTRR
jgi:AraC-like DNA-binding protein